MSYKLDIFALFDKLNSSKSGNIYASLTDDEKKGFSPLIIMRWLSGTSDERQIILLNEFVNKNVFPLAKHPELLMRLLHAASSKTGKRYQWMGVKSNKKNSETIRAVADFLDMSAREARLLDPFPPDDEVLKMAECLGWQKDELAKLKKEFKDE